MLRRQAMPRVWLLTDDRTDAALEAALARLPRGAGVIFRHHRLHPAERRARYQAVRRIARARRLTLLVAGPPKLAIAWRADGTHGPSPYRVTVRSLLRTAAAHDRRELAAVRRGGATPLLSPIFPTRSHPGARTLGPVRFGLVARSGRGEVVALGGMDARRFRRMRALGATGWAGIDAWTGAAT